MHARRHERLAPTSANLRERRCTAGAWADPRPHTHGSHAPTTTYVMLRRCRTRRRYRALPAAKSCRRLACSQRRLSMRSCTASPSRPLQRQTTSKLGRVAPLVPVQPLTGALERLHLAYDKVSVNRKLLHILHSERFELAGLANESRVSAVQSRWCTLPRPQRPHRQTAKTAS